MPQSATTTRATERMAATAARITALSRSLTADHGLAGFTIERLCDEIGVSRRTFFNYFASKEDAVIGVDEVNELERFTSDFLAKGSRGWPAVVDDLLQLAVAHASATGFGAAEHATFIAALSREPRLLARFIGVSREREATLAELVALREGVPLDDPHASAAVSLVATMMRQAGERVIASQPNDDFATLLNETLTVYRALLVPDEPEEPGRRKDTP